jgi:NAD/NADP transhydrogenase beta subunit
LTAVHYKLTQTHTQGLGYAEVDSIASTTAAVCCIGGIGGLSSQRTARLGNVLGMGGVGLGVVATVGTIGPTFPQLVQTVRHYHFLIQHGSYIVVAGVVVYVASTYSTADCWQLTVSVLAWCATRALTGTLA